MKILKYIWLVLVNLIQLLIILWIFSYVNTWFETIVVSLLILIYISINFYIVSNSYSEISKLIWFIEEFINLKILLKDPKLLQFYDNEDDMYKEILEKPKKTLESITPKFYIDWSFGTLFLVICIINILKVIMN